jgi:hypothetical protein
MLSGKIRGWAGKPTRPAAGAVECELLEFYPQRKNASAGMPVKRWPSTARPANAAQAKCIALHQGAQVDRGRIGSLWPDKGGQGGDEADVVLHAFTYYCRPTLRQRLAVTDREHPLAEVMKIPRCHRHFRLSKRQATSGAAQSGERDCALRIWIVAGCTKARQRCADEVIDDVKGGSK